MLRLQVPVEPSKSIDSHVVVGLLVKLLNPRELKLLGRANKHFVSSVCPHVRELSAGQIQCVWRRYGWRLNTKDLAKAFCTAKLSDAGARSFEFDEIVKFLRRKHVVRIAKHFLRRIVYGCAEFSKTKPEGKEYTIRVFLAAYMIGYFAEHVFEFLGETERDLIAATSLLLACVHSIAEKLAETGCFLDLPRDLVTDLLGHVHVYHTAFTAWQTPDKAMLLGRMERATRALLQAYALIDPYNPLDEPVRQEFRVQTRRLFNKFVEMGAAAELQQFERYKVGTLSYETFDPANPIDWELWANYHAEIVSAMQTDEYWEAWATEHMVLAW